MTRQRHVPADVPAASRSTALAGAASVTLDRPEWASPHIPAHRRPLPLIVAEAVRRPESVITGDRLSTRTRAWGLGRWSGELARLREDAARIRRRTLADLDGYLEQLQQNVEAHGGVVHRAADAAEALAAVESVVRRHGAPSGPAAGRLTWWTTSSLPGRWWPSCAPARAWWPTATRSWHR